MEKRSRFVQKLITEIKKTAYPLELVPQLIERKLVSEKPGPGLLLIWNDDLLNKMTKMELTHLHLGLNAEAAIKFAKKMEDLYIYNKC